MNTFDQVTQIRSDFETKAEKVKQNKDEISGSMHAAAHCKPKSAALRDVRRL